MRIDGVDARIEQIAEALRAVHARIPHSEDAIPFTHTIPMAARAIYLAWRPPETNTVKPSQWHSRFQKKASELLDLLYNMPKDLIPDVFQDGMSGLCLSLAIAIENSTSAPKRKAGRPESLEARCLGITVANFYFNLTGRRPGVTRKILTIDDPISETETCTETESRGEFFLLLEKIFKILGVKADPRTIAEFVRYNWDVIDKAPGIPLCMAAAAAKGSKKNANSV